MNERAPDFSKLTLRRIGGRITKKEFPQDSRFLELTKTSCWSDLAEHLREYPQSIQSNFLIKLFGPQGFNFPNGAKLGGFLAEVNNIPWFNPTPYPSKDYLQEQVNQHLLALNLPPKPIKIIKDNWVAADDASRTVSWTALWIASWTALRAASEAALGTALEAASLAASRAASWIVVEDLMPERGYRNGNPFIPLINIFKTGSWPINLVKDQFNIFVPKLS